MRRGGRSPYPARISLPPSRSALRWTQTLLRSRSERRRVAHAGCLLPLLRHAFGRRVGWQGDPGMARLLPHRDGRSGESRVGKVADRNGDMSWEAFAIPVDGRAAGWTKMKGHRVAAF